MEIKDYRNSVFVLDENREVLNVKLSKWGGGEYKLENMENVKGSVIIFIPYLTLKTLEKAYVIKRFLIKNKVDVQHCIIGYCSYSRQERETENEPELLKRFLNSVKIMLGRCYVIDGHNVDSFIRNGFLITSSYRELLKSIKEDYVIVAPDKGARLKNRILDIKTDICMKKTRKDGQVITQFDKDYSTCDGRKTTFVILDDICDGGRTFANTCKILKEAYPKCNVILAVAHAILPYGIDLLKESGIDKIITTNTCFPTGEHYDGFVDSINIIKILPWCFEGEKAIC
ncbi:ribose-phosphate diphosphokinase [Clostridium sardiniense]